MLRYPKSEVLEKYYNSYGYNGENTWSCEEIDFGSEIRDRYTQQLSQSMLTHYADIFPFTTLDQKHFKEYILHDEFGRTYLFPVAFKDGSPSVNCIFEYFAYVRRRVEKLFPVEKFNSFCNPDTQEQTGSRKFHFKSILAKSC